MGTSDPCRSYVDQPERAAVVVRVAGRCPNCGRETAVVFPFIPAGVRTEDAKLVCLACCPTNPNGIEVGIERRAG